MKIDCNLLAEDGREEELTCLDRQQVGDTVQVGQAVLGLCRLQLGLSLDSHNLRWSNIEIFYVYRVSDLGLILDEDDSLLGPGVVPPVQLTNLGRLSRSEELKGYCTV